MSVAKETKRAFKIGSETIEPGQRSQLELKVARLPSGTWVSLPIAVLHGKKPGPKIWVAAAIHGDEINGVEIVRQVLPKIPLSSLKGTIVACPIVNVFGFLHQERYLPDRRDLNRCFPGSNRGSLASRLAHLFMTEIVDRCDFGIDLHTGSHHRTNYPQIRVNLNDPRSLELAQAFGAPVIMHSKGPRGSLRQELTLRDQPAVLYEAGEPLRFDNFSIQVGVQGVLNILRSLNMIPHHDDYPVPSDSAQIVYESKWVRAPRSGIVIIDVHPGQRVEKGEPIAHVTDMFSNKERKSIAPFDGIVLGQTVNPLVNRGDAIIHLGMIE